MSEWEVKARGPQYGKGQLDLDEYCCQMFGVHTHFEYIDTLTTYTLGVHRHFEYIDTLTTYTLGVHRHLDYIHTWST